MAPARHSPCSTEITENYNNGTEVQFCELVGLADLATETEYVRSRLAEYINDLISLGVDGLRLDAVKRKFSDDQPPETQVADPSRDVSADMPAADIANILSRVDRPLYITQEVRQLRLSTKGLLTTTV